MKLKFEKSLVACTYLHSDSVATHMIHSNVYSTMRMLVADSLRMGCRLGDGDEYSQRCEVSRFKPLIPCWAGACPQLPDTPHSATERVWAVAPEYGRNFISITVHLHDQYQEETNIYLRFRWRKTATRCYHHHWAAFVFSRVKTKCQELLMGASTLTFHMVYIMNIDNKIFMHDIDH